MVFFVGAGPGAPDLITMRGHDILSRADVIIYAGSLVNPKLLEYAKKGCEIHDSAKLTLEQVIDIAVPASKAGKTVARLHTGDPCLFGAIKEQMDLLDEHGVEYEVCPGVSSFCGAAAAINAEYTLPGVTQSVILTRMEGRTPVPETEDIAALAAHKTSMAIFLSSGMLDSLTGKLMSGGLPGSTPAAIVYKATWPDEKKIITTVDKLADAARENGISKTALILVGGFLGGPYERSKLYDPGFAHGYRGADK
ncbi:precorrin-4 C(11)-methyltransferase [Clostridia bacterium]|nr:precorrin-4 C(11)-methyltransferase [Clostridia bacterium]